MAKDAIKEIFVAGTPLGKLVEAGNELDEEIKRLTSEKKRVQALLLARSNHILATHKSFKLVGQKAMVAVSQSTKLILESDSHMSASHWVKLKGLLGASFDLLFKQKISGDRGNIEKFLEAKQTGEAQTAKRTLLQVVEFKPDTPRCSFKGLKGKQSKSPIVENTAATPDVEISVDITDWVNLRYVMTTQDLQSLAVKNGIDISDLTVRDKGKLAERIALRLGVEKTE